jgi:hypothetical protein
MGESQAQNKIILLKLWEKVLSAIILTLLNFSLLFSILKLLVIGMISVSGISSFYLLLGLTGAALLGAIIWAVVEQLNLTEEIKKTNRLFTTDQVYVLSPTSQNRHLCAHLADYQPRPMSRFSHEVRVVFNWLMRPFMIMSTAKSGVALVRSLLGHPPLTLTQLMWTVGASLLLGLILSGIGWHVDLRKENSRGSLLLRIKAKIDARRKTKQPIFAPKKIQKYQDILHILGAVGRVLVPFVVYVTVQSLIPTHSLGGHPHWASMVAACLIWGMVELMARGKTMQVIGMVRVLGVFVGTLAASYLALRLFLSTFMKISFLSMAENTGMMALLYLAALLCGIVAATMDYVQQRSPTTRIAGNIMALSPLYLPVNLNRTGTVLAPSVPHPGRPRCCT